MKVLVVNAVGTLVVCGLIVPVPPLASKVTVKEGSAVHWA